MDFMEERLGNLPDGGKIIQDKMYLTVANRRMHQKNNGKEAVKQEIATRLYHIFEKYR